MIAILVLKPIGSISSGVEASSPPQLANIHANAQILINLILITCVMSPHDENTLLSLG